jgi:hypothetical protein
VDPGDPRDLEEKVFLALKQPRGLVPVGLDYFSYETFANRVHEWTGTIFGPEQWS